MKRNILILITILLIIAILTVSIFVFFSKKETDKKELNKEEFSENMTKKKCMPFTGGSFNLIFDTNGGEELESMNICIACSPDSYLDIPIPEKEGSKFLGWFTDKEFTNPIHFTNTKDLKSVPKYDKNNCMIGYENITIHAKWDDEDKDVGAKPLQERTVI